MQYSRASARLAEPYGTSTTVLDSATMERSTSLRDTDTGCSRVAQLDLARVVGSTMQHCAKRQEC